MPSYYDTTCAGDAIQTRICAQQADERPDPGDLCRVSCCGFPLRAGFKSDLKAQTMKRALYSEQQIIGIPAGHDADATRAGLCREAMMCSSGFGRDAIRRLTSAAIRSRRRHD